MIFFGLQKEIKASEVPPLQTILKSNKGQSQGHRSVSSNHSSPRGGSDQSNSDMDDLLDPNFINHNNNVVKPRVTKAVTQKQQPMLKSSSLDSSAFNNSLDHVIKTNVLSNGATSGPDLLPPQASLTPVTQLEESISLSHAPNLNHSNQNNGVSNQNNGPSNQNGGVLSNATQPQLYRAIKDYDPRHYSRSGHPHRELSLKEGSIVKALGSVDSKGYLEGQCNGKVGLVPVNYLEPVRERKSSAPQGMMGNSGEPVNVQVHANFTRSQTLPNQAGMIAESVT